MAKVVRTPAFQKDVDRLRPDYPRIDAALDGVEAALRNNPTCKPMVFVDYGIRAISLSDFPGVPAANVYYQAAKVEVRLLYIQLVDQEAQELPSKPKGS